MLTKSQELFVQYLVRGESQREAMLKAYPSRRSWKSTSVDSNAWAMAKNPKIVARYEELLTDIRKEETKKTMWDRERSVETLKYVIQVNIRDLERIQEASEEELELLQQQIEEQPEKALVLIDRMIRNRKSRRASQVNNKGIVDAVAELNKMYGFNEENINFNGAVIFTGEDELED